MSENHCFKFTAKSIRNSAEFRRKTTYQRVNKLHAYFHAKLRRAQVNQLLITILQEGNNDNFQYQPLNQTIKVK